MPISDISQEVAHIKLSLSSLRKAYPGVPDLDILAEVLRQGEEEITPEALRYFARSRKKFSTADVMQYFSADKYKVAACLATLRAEGSVLPDDPKKDELGYSLWVSS